MNFTQVYSHTPTSRAANAAKQIKSGSLARFLNMPSNVYQEEKLNHPTPEFSPEADPNQYSQIKQAHRTAYRLLRHLAPKMMRLNFWVDLSLTGTFRSMLVFDGLEPVGGVDFNDGTGALQFTNNRISGALHRGTCMRTTNDSKAASIIRKYFYGMSKVETLSATAVTIDRAVSSAYQDTKYKLSCATRNIVRELEEAAFSDPLLSQAVQQYFKAKGNGEYVAAHKDAAEDLTLVSEAAKAQSRGQGLYLQAAENGYHIWQHRDTKVRTYKRELLPDKVRGAIGLLKMTEDNSFISNVGFKHTEGMFWVSEEIANELNS